VLNNYSVYAGCMLIINCTFLCVFIKSMVWAVPCVAFSFCSFVAKYFFQSYYVYVREGSWLSFVLIFGFTGDYFHFISRKYQMYSIVLTSFSWMGERESISLSKWLDKWQWQMTNSISSFSFEARASIQKVIGASGLKLKGPIF